MTVTAAQVKELRELTGIAMMDCKKALVETDGDLEKAIILLRERGMARASNKSSRTASEGSVQVAVTECRRFGAIVEVNCETDFAAKNADFQEFASNLSKIMVADRLKDKESLLKGKMPDGKDVSESLAGLVASIGENIQIRRASALEVSDNGAVFAYSHMGGKIGTLVSIQAQGQLGEIPMNQLGMDLAMHVAAAAPRYLNRTEVPETELEQEKDIARTRLREQGKPEAIIEKALLGHVERFYRDVCLENQDYVKDPKLDILGYMRSMASELRLQGFRRYQLGEGIEKKQENFAKEVAAQLS